MVILPSKIPMMFKSLLTAILFMSIFNISYGTNKLRNLKTEKVFVKNTISVPCLSGVGMNCICPGGCMIKPGNNSAQCTLKPCWKWDEDLTKCQGTGPKFTPAIILQGIPFTGAFGSGFGNMGRWDLFGIGSIIWGSGVSLICLSICCHLYSVSDGDSLGSGCAYCYTILLSQAIFIYWLWGIAVIAEKNILGPNGCPFADGT
jgi:hypothetical protein